jgi:hypothetical protein
MYRKLHNLQFWGNGAQVVNAGIADFAVMGNGVEHNSSMWEEQWEVQSFGVLPLSWVHPLLHIRCCIVAVVIGVNV